MNDTRKESCEEQGNTLTEPQHRLRAGVNASSGVNAPNDVKHGKAGTEAMPLGEAFLGGCPGDYEACVPSKNVWSLLVAAWKSISLLLAMTSCPMPTYRSRSL